MDANIGHSEQGEGAGGGGSKAERLQRRPGIKPTLPEALEILTQAIVTVYEVGGQVERMTVDGSPAFLLRGAKIERGKLVVDK